jgi:FkbM family methyltransferase
MTIPREKYNYLNDSVIALEGIKRWSDRDIPRSITEFISQNIQRIGNYSQLQADFVALFFKRTEPGFFVEFGACDGIRFSNTYILEKAFGWEGILAEPGRNWSSQLARNRTSHIDFRCLSGDDSMEVEFSEDSAAEFSSLSIFTPQNLTGPKKNIRKKYKVKTVSLNTLLLDWSSPKVIDYISVDTEGGELEILEKFSFAEWDVQFFSIEHNFTSNESKIDALLHKNGYTRIFKNITLWDGWYIKNTNQKWLDLQSEFSKSEG